MKTLPLWAKSKRKIYSDDNENFKKYLRNLDPRAFSLRKWDWLERKKESSGRRQGLFPPLSFSQGKTMGTTFIFASRVNFSIDDVDGSEIVIFRMNSRFFKLFCVYFKCRRISLKLISWGPHSSLERERKIRRRLFTSWIKREIGHFQVVVVQVPERNIQKLKREARTKLLFCLINLLLFWRSRSRSRRRR